MSNSSSSWGDLGVDRPCRICVNKKSVPDTFLYKCKFYLDGYFDNEFRNPGCKHYEKKVTNNP